jgi:hypothetical protein
VSFDNLVLGRVAQKLMGTHTHAHTALCAGATGSVSASVTVGQSPRGAGMQQTGMWIGKTGTGTHADRVLGNEGDAVLRVLCVCLRASVQCVQCVVHVNCVCVCRA